jgi:hypothetical protein
MLADLNGRLIKHDGCRIIAREDGDRVRLWSRNGRDWSREFVVVTEAIRALKRRPWRACRPLTANCYAVCCSGPGRCPDLINARKNFPGCIP